ncbi:MAG: PDZ domain-containing protein [Lachnospiraceae bacterium]|nr:PDZ domain-containing protein [Lachnospiraceae bacterium]
MKIVIALLIFSLIIIIHELGHFLLARFNGVEVTEFSLGMGPRIFTFVKTDKGIRIKFFASQKYCDAQEDFVGKTMYSIKILPFGGSCIMLGEDDVVDAENAFCKKNVYQRMSIVFAGPFFNFLLAFILSIIIVAVAGYDKPMVVSVEDGMPMKEAGVMAGDEIVEINGSRIHLDREISTYFMMNPLSEDEDVTFTIKRGEEKFDVTVQAKLAPSENVSDGFAETVTGEDAEPVGTYRVGFVHGAERVKGNVVDVIKYSVYEVKYWIVTTVKSLGMMITGQVGKDEISGPVGIVNTIGDLVDDSKDFGISSVMLTLMSFCILLSANLGVMNLLPIPALDGGRLLFQIIEVIRRKPINPEKEGMITVIGFVALMILMVFILFNDITKIIFG